jgi:glutamyl-tRNA synthetase
LTASTRFAPSPTGRLHVGNARVALLNWLLARAAAGQFLLRIDDTDAKRSRPELVQAIEDDLRWLGLDWDARYSQSERTAAYDDAFARLRDAGAAYPCYETPEELAAKRAAQRAAGRPPVYDRAALRLNDTERRALEGEGRRAHWRFRLPDRPIRWDDLIQGAKTVPPGAVSDPVIRRADGSPTFLFAGAVDDGELAVTHVLRGEDHVTNTGAQLALIEALGWPAPRFGHLPLLVDAAGKGLSKRLGGLSLEALRDEGLEPGALLGYLAVLGTGREPRPVATPADLLDGFNLSAYSRAPPRFDVEQLHRLSVTAVRDMPFDAVRVRLQALGAEGADAAFWDMVRPNVASFAEAAAWWAICHAPLVPVIDAADRDMLAGAADLLPEFLDGDDYDGWLARLQAASGRKGKALFRPLRLALTGREHGPELRLLLTQLPRFRVEARLRGRTA